MTLGPFTRALATAGALGVGALAWACLEVRWFALRRFVVPVLEPGAPSLRVLHISDLHLTPRRRETVAWVRDLARLEPDLVINTGDNLAHPDALPTVLEALEPLLELPGAFVMGSNDYYAPVPKNPARYLRADPRDSGPPLQARLPGEDLRSAFSSAGWADLDNRRQTVETDGRRVALVGVDDAHLDRDRFPARAAEGSGGEPPADVRLGVTHAPYRRILDAMHADGADLILAGHTHGGQLCVPFHGALVTNCDLDPGRAKGLHGWPGARPDDPADRPGGDIEAGGDVGAAAGSTWLHVSAGLGTSPYAPVRFACRPEASLLTLVGR